MSSVTGGACLGAGAFRSACLRGAAGIAALMADSADAFKRPIHSSIEDRAFTSLTGAKLAWARRTYSRASFGLPAASDFSACSRLICAE